MGGAARELLSRFGRLVGPVKGAVLDPFRSDVVVAVGDKKLALKGVLERMTSLLLEPRRQSEFHCPDRKFVISTQLRNFGDFQTTHLVLHTQDLRNADLSPDESAPAVRATEMDELEYAATRFHEVCDFWHVLFGLDTDIIGKSALKGIECQQMLIMCKMYRFAGGTARLP